MRAILRRHAHSDLIAEMKEKGWHMASYGRGMNWFCLSEPHYRPFLHVSIEKRRPCPMCEPIDWTEAEALAWDELSDWVSPDKLRRLIADQR